MGLLRSPVMFHLVIKFKCLSHTLAFVCIFSLSALFVFKHKAAYILKVTAANIFV